MRDFLKKQVPMSVVLISVAMVIAPICIVGLSGNFDDLTVKGFAYLATESGNVGIGTTTPNSTLTIYGTAPQTRIVSSASGETETKIIFQNADRIWEVGNSFANVGASKFAIYDSTQGGGRLVIDTTGKVGIGTTQPTERLTVDGNITLNNATPGLGLVVKDSVNGLCYRIRTTNGNVVAEGVPCQQ